jgi:hypothetical protein
VKKCAFCPNKISPTEDHYRDHDKRLVCKACFKAWKEAKR